MRNFILLIAISFFSAAGIAQVPQLFKYQGLARAADGTPLADSAISIRISIHKDSPAGTVVYRETHNVVTNTFGTFSINIGGGVVNLGIFSTIPWGRHLFFQEVELNNVSMGTAQYLSVPYAMAADSAKAGIGPFIVQNTLPGNDTSSVAVVALSNGTAPTIYSRNLGAGESIVVEGRSLFVGEVSIEDTLRINGNIKVNGSVLNPGFSNFQVFNSSGSFTVPAGVTKLMVEVWAAGGGGGGGGGGGYGNYGGTGGGGGGGGYVKDIISVNSGDVITVTIGTGGNGGNGGGFCPVNCTGTAGNAGTNGGSSTFGMLTAGGGSGGNGGQGGQNGSFGAGGSGGTGGNAPGPFGTTGQFGFNGSANGFGGSSPNGGFGGNPGGDKSPGGGGSGGVGQVGNGNAGGNGGNGRILVWW